MLALDADLYTSVFEPLKWPVGFKGLRVINNSDRKGFISLINSTCLYFWHVIFNIFCMIDYYKGITSHIIIIL